MNNDSDISLIGRFFDGELNNQEVKDFEERLNGDPAFSSLFYQEKLLIRGIINSGRKSLMNRLKNLERTLPKIDSTERGKIIKLDRFYWAAASVVALLSISSVLFYLLGASESSADLYAEYYKPYPNVISVTQRGEEKELNELEMGFQAYENNFFEKAIEHFEKAISHNDTPILKFYIGSSYMGLNKTKNAIPWFEEVVGDSEVEFHDQANWYLALCYLKEDNREKAKYFLLKLQVGEGSYKKRASELIDELN